MIERIGIEQRDELMREMLRVRGYNVLYPHQDTLTKVVKETGDFYEARALDVIRDLRPEGIFIDVGAHCGNHSAYFLRECNPAALIAIEPAHDMLPFLDANISNNRAVPAFIVTAAAGSLQETGNYVSSANADGNHTGGRTTIPHASGNHAVMVTSIDAVVLAVREMLGERLPVGYIKLDCEGAEVEALTGALSTIGSDRPIISAECAIKKRPDGSSQRVAGAAIRDAITELLDDWAPGGYSRPVRFPARSESYLWKPLPSTTNA